MDRTPLQLNEEEIDDGTALQLIYKHTAWKGREDHIACHGKEEPHSTCHFEHDLPK